MTDRRPIYTRLVGIFIKDELIDAWINRPHPQLGHVPPRLLVDQGRAEEVHALIDEIAETVKES